MCTETTHTQVDVNYVHIYNYTNILLSTKVGISDFDSALLFRTELIYNGFLKTGIADFKNRKLYF